MFPYSHAFLQNVPIRFELVSNLIVDTLILALKKLLVDEESHCIPTYLDNGATFVKVNSDLEDLAKCLQNNNYENETFPNNLGIQRNFIPVYALSLGSWD